MITLAPAKRVTGAVIKQGGTYSDPRRVGGPDGLLARLIPFTSQGSLAAHRYNTEDNRSAPMTSGGYLPSSLSVPATAVYVVYSYRTPIAWVDADGTVTVPDVRYSVTTTHHQGQCRAWLGSKVKGIKR